MNSAPFVYNSKKPIQYYRGARREFVDDLPVNPRSRLLEVGCGSGDTAAYALATGKCGRCDGVEVDLKAGSEAQKKLNRVVVGDVESLELPFAYKEFDILILSEVLEHFREPIHALVKLRQYLRSGAVIHSGSPNVAHISVIRMLLCGRWDYTTSGIMDSTHLRWFTASTYRELFERAGFTVEYVRPARPIGGKSKIINALLFNRLPYLFYSQIWLKAHLE